MDAMTWKMCMKSYSKFFDTVEKVEDKSLALSAEVLKKCEDLQSDLRFIAEAIQERSHTMARFQAEKVALLKYEQEMKKHAQLEFGESVELETKSCAPEKSVNCNSCERTCHHPCTAPSVSKCEIFDWCGSCKYCQCGTSDHSRNTYIYVFVSKKSKRTREEIKARYTEALKGKDDTASIVKEIEKDYEKTKREVAEKAERARACLEEISGPLSGSEYIELLIKAERSEGKPGYQERIEAFKEIQNEMGNIEKVEKVTEKVVGGKTKFQQTLH